MSIDIKTQALLTVAEAYFNRGLHLQYDQRCMDRNLFLTPRRTKLLPPEAATEQYTLFLDCSSFVGAVYYETFGYELSSDLTWHMIDLIEPRLFYYELTHEETEEEKAEIRQKIREILTPGDVIVYDRYVGSGHTLIYMGGERYLHCTSSGRPDSYDYVNCKSREYESGGIFEGSMTELLEEKIFDAKLRRIAVLRPLEVMGNITENSVARLSGAKDLMCSTLVSHPGCNYAVSGEDVRYSIKVKNCGNEEKAVTADFVAPEGTSLKSKCSAKTNISPGEESVICFDVTIADSEVFLIESAEIKVNGLKVHCPKIQVGKKIERNMLEEIILLAREKTSCEKNALEAAAEAYEKAGIKITSSEKRIIEEHFYLHDSPGGDVLTRRRQNPYKDYAVYSLFGGKGVSTPEFIYDFSIRCNRPTRREFLPGDIIICSDDACALQTYSAFYTGESLVGSFEYGGQAKILTGEKIDEFIDSLLGRFCFIVLRPSLIAENF